jgi:multicomponent Na+:H+ antiporter subunit G
VSIGTVADVAAGVLVLTGALLALTAGIGVARLGDVLDRMHAATKPATLGLVLVVAGAVLRVSDLADATKLVLVVVLQFLTAPVGAHLIGRAALRSGAPHEPFVLDERAGDGQAEGELPDQGR